MFLKDDSALWIVLHRRCQRQRSQLTNEFWTNTNPQYCVRWRGEYRKAYNQVAHHLIGSTEHIISKAVCWAPLHAGGCVLNVNIIDAYQQWLSKRYYKCLLHSRVRFTCVFPSRPLNQSFSSCPLFFSSYCNFLTASAFFFFRCLCFCTSLCINPRNLLIKLLSLQVTYPLLRSYCFVALKFQI